MKNQNYIEGYNKNVAKIKPKEKMFKNSSIFIEKFIQLDFD